MSGPILRANLRLNNVLLDSICLSIYLPAYLSAYLSIHWILYKDPRMGIRHNFLMVSCQQLFIKIQCFALFKKLCCQRNSNEIRVSSAIGARFEQQGNWLVLRSNSSQKRNKLNQVNQHLNFFPVLSKIISQNRFCALQPQLETFLSSIAVLKLFNE